jgi:hypothetical protein
VTENADSHMVYGKAWLTVSYVHITVLFETEILCATTTILDVIHCSLSYLKQFHRFVRTSQETHYVSAMSPTN